MSDQSDATFLAALVDACAVEEEVVFVGRLGSPGAEA